MSDLKALDAAQAAYDQAAKASAVAAGQGWTPEIVKFLTVSVLVFTVVALLLCTVLLWRAAAQAQQVLKVLGIVVILGLATLLLVVGYSSEQLTPIVGLFGAIAGYLAGKDDGAIKARDENGGQKNAPH